MPEKQSAKIVEEIFGTGGLTSLDTSVSFVDKALEIERKYGEKCGTYRTENLLLAVKSHVFDMTKNDSRIPLNLKNNHCEAMNHILKFNLKWKPAKMPDLVKMLQKE